MQKVNTYLFCGICSQLVCDITLVASKKSTSTFLMGHVPNLSVMLPFWWAKTKNLPFMWDLFLTCLQYHSCRMQKLNIYLLCGICSQLVCNLTLTLCKHHSLPFSWDLFPNCLQHTRSGHNRNLRSRPAE